MSLEPGARLGPYEVTAQIGAGGMGEVYQARDTKLGRDVALKILPGEFASDPERLARFQREARVLASLNHPNIAAIYGLEDSGDTHALVLELVEGPTLADLIAGGMTRALPLDEALPIARQIADALEAAHEQGIIHRDLKPANIKLRPDGTVKVLDFGLAKALDVRSAGGSAPAADAADSESPTMSMTAAATRMGVIMGTAAYMAPEQARGKPVDKRTDIWAFGAVLFEMLTGSKPFPGDDISQTLARVIDREPDWDALPANVPAGLVTYLRRCLEKDPKQRVRDIGDVGLALDGAFDVDASAVPASKDTTAPVAAQSAWRRAAPVAAALVVGMLTAGLAVWTLARPDTVAEVARFDVTPDEGLTILTISPSVAISPDGRTVAFLTGGTSQAASRLHVRSLNRLDSTILIEDGVVGSPFFSPDGTQIGFYENLGGGPPNVLKRVSIEGGPPSTIAPIGNTVLRGASWGADGTIVFADNDPEAGLWRVPAAGGEPEPLTIPGEPEPGDHMWPELLPTGDAVLFTMVGTSEDESRIAALSLATGDIQVLVAGGSYPRYASTGHLIFGRAGTLWAVRFDASRLAIEGDPVPVLEGILTKGVTGAAEVSLSANGTLLHVTGETDSTLGRRLVWVDTDGREEPVPTPLGSFDAVALSPDGTRAAIGTAGAIGGLEEIWIADLTRGTLQPLTRDTGPTRDRFPLWAPDGRRVAFWSNRSGGSALFLQSADGTDDIELLVSLSAIAAAVPSSWSPDGTELTLGMLGESGVGTITVGDPGSLRLTHTGENTAAPAISPDGRWLAYVSRGGGAGPVIVERFPEGGGRQVVSIGGGRLPTWSADGRSISYLRYEGGPSLAMMRASISGGRTPGEPLQIEPAVELFPWTYYERPSGGRYFDMTPDGERFLVISSASRATRSILTQNFVQELLERAP